MSAAGHGSEKEPFKANYPPSCRFWTAGQGDLRRGLAAVVLESNARCRAGSNGSSTSRGHRAGKGRRHSTCSNNSCRMEGACPVLYCTSTVLEVFEGHTSMLPEIVDRLPLPPTSLGGPRMCSAVLASALCSQRIGGSKERKAWDRSSGTHYVPPGRP